MNQARQVEMTKRDANQITSSEWVKLVVQDARHIQKEIAPYKGKSDLFVIWFNQIDGDGTHTESMGLSGYCKSLDEVQLPEGMLAHSVKELALDGHDKHWITKTCGVTLAKFVKMTAEKRKSLFYAHQMHEGRALKYIIDKRTGFRAINFDNSLTVFNKWQDRMHLWFGISSEQMTAIKEECDTVQQYLNRIGQLIKGREIEATLRNNSYTVGVDYWEIAKTRKPQLEA